MVTARKRYAMTRKDMESLRIKAELDQMTGIYNKVTTENLIREALNQSDGEINAMMIVDVDNFKTVNDREGHQVGDHTLCIISNVMTGNFREEDIVGRIGGDEFVVFMRNVSSMDGARKKAQMLVDVIKCKVNLTIPDYVSLSIGLAISSECGLSYEELFRRCDEALYESKNNGKCRYTEYGKAEQPEEVQEGTVAIFSENRSIQSQIESSVREFYRCSAVADTKELGDMMSKEEGRPEALFLDISSEEDLGQKLLQETDTLLSRKEIPVYVICEEENLEQYQIALQMKMTKDILQPPMDLPRIKRKMERLKNQ